jgi:hypothetical protein
MTRVQTIVSPLIVAVVMFMAGVAWAGAPTPDDRSKDFEHVCQKGPNKDQPCTVATQATDCPKSECVPKTLSKTFKGTLTLIADGNVRDWLNGTVMGNQALTVMLEVKAPDGTKHILAQTYQDLAFPAGPPQAPLDVIAFDLDETHVKDLNSAVSGLVFAQPEGVIASELQTLFGVTGTPVIIEAKDKKVDFADHTTDNLATVLRFKVKLQFVDPI